MAACAEHSGDWLFALPLASCGLHLDDEARASSGLPEARTGRLLQS